MLPNDEYFLYRAIACLYEKPFRSSVFAWESTQYALKKINCMELVQSACQLNFEEEHIDCIVDKLVNAANLEKSMCEKIKNSHGLRQILLTETHDANVADAQKVGLNLILTLQLNSGQTIDEIFYTEVMQITFVNISSCSCENAEDIIGLFVSMHYEKVLDNNILFSIEFYKDFATIDFALCCEDVKVEHRLVND